MQEAADELHEAQRHAAEMLRANLPEPPELPKATLKGKSKPVRQRDRFRYRHAAASSPTKSSPAKRTLTTTKQRITMVAVSWADRLARLPISEEELVEGLARALYMTHRQEAAPGWEHASEYSRDWVRAQAREALAHLRGLTRPAK